MIKINMLWDDLASMLVSYHVLCMPQELTSRFNPDVINKFRIPGSEAGEYSRYLKSQYSIKGGNDVLQHRYYLIDEAVKSGNLEEFLAEHSMPDSVKKNLRAFQGGFAGFLDDIKQSKAESFQKCRELMGTIMQSIYTTAFEITSTKIPTPNELEVRVVKGLEPSSKGSEYKYCPGKQYVFMQSKHLDESRLFITTLIHECVGHKSASPSRKFFREVFSKDLFRKETSKSAYVHKEYIYEIEESFVKTFIKKVFERITWKEVPSRIDFEEKTYPEFGDRWQLLEHGHFKEWYRDCLAAIKDRLDA